MRVSSRWDRWEDRGCVGLRRCGEMREIRIRSAQEHVRASKSLRRQCVRMETFVSTKWIEIERLAFKRCENPRVMSEARRMWEWDGEDRDLEDCGDFDAFG
jgi:hypothetical protein